MNVWPTNSGTMVQARAQVLIGAFWPCWFSRSTFKNNLGLMKGPFFNDLPICLYTPCPRDEIDIRCLVDGSVIRGASIVHTAASAVAARWPSSRAYGDGGSDPPSRSC